MTDSNLNLPNILVIGLQGKLGINLINGITGCETIVSDIPDNYPWFIENKYYTTTVNFCNIKDVNDLNSPVLSRGEAIIIYIDPSKEAVLEEVNLILKSFSGQSELETQILVVDNFEKLQDNKQITGLSKLEALNWSIKHNFELVELNSNECEDPEEDENDDISLDGPLQGFIRIKEALHAHSWSNLQLKDQMDRNTKVLQAGNLCIDENLRFPEIENSTNLRVAEIDDFASLLSSLGDMKVKASALPCEERKSYAEKMAISFWKSLGGDDEEIRDLNSDTE